MVSPTIKTIGLDTPSQFGAPYKLVHPGASALCGHWDISYSDLKQKDRSEYSTRNT